MNTVTKQDDDLVIEWSDHGIRWTEILWKVKELPDRRYRKTPSPHWRVPAQPHHARQAIKLLSPFGFYFDKEVHDLSAADSNKRKANKTSTRRKIRGLYDYQSAAVGFIREAGGRAIIGDDIGLGKTIEALGYCYTERKRAVPALVVAPANVTYKWRSEILDDKDRFPWSGRWTAQVLATGKTPLQSEMDWTICSYDMLRTRRAELVDRGYRLVIFDEFHYLKNPKAARTKAGLLLAERAERVLGLSGTPLLNKPIELFNMLHAIAPNAWPSRSGFGYRYCGGHDPEGWFQGASNISELSDRLKSVMIRRLKSEVLTELPELTVSILPVDVDLRQYNKVRANVSAAISALSPESKGYWVSILDQLNYLRQASGHAKVFPVLAWSTNFLDSTSLERKLLIYVHHKQVARSIMEGLSDYEVDSISGSTPQTKREGIAEAFRNGPSPRVLVISSAGGEGIDLFGEAGNTCSDIVFAELEWRPSDFEQAWGRLHRTGQTNPVNAWIFKANGTIDQRMYGKVQSKRAMIKDILGDI